MARLEHVGIAVEDVVTVVDCFQDLLGTRPYKFETVVEQDVRTHFIDAKGPKIELLEAVGNESPIRRFLDRSGEGLHHLAFDVSDAAATMEELRGAGFTLLSDHPQPGADDKKIFFVHPKDTHGVLVEFCESVSPSWTPHVIRHREGTLSVFERGDPDRPTLLCIHGAAGSTLLETAPLIRRLEPSFHTIGVDLSGHGASSFPPNTALGMDAFVEDAMASLDALDQSSAHIFGFSLGGAVALRMAQVSPESVERLTLFQTNARWPPALSAQMQRRLDLEGIRDRAPDRADALRSVHDQPNRLFRELRSFVDTLPDVAEPMWSALSNITALTLVSSVDRDPLFGADVPRRLHDELPNSRLAIVPGEEHSLPGAPIPILAALLRDFLTGADPVPPPRESGPPDSVHT